MMTTDERQLDLSSLTDDGDTIELGDGRTLRLRIENDDTPVMDQWSDDCYGRVEWIDPHAIARWQDRTGNYNGAPRPAGFDGNAEKLHLSLPPNGSSDYYWWQPPADVPRTSEHFRTMRAAVEELLTWGYYSVGVELLDGTDAYGRPIVANAAWLGGIEPNYGSYLAEVISDLVAELEVIE